MSGGLGARLGSHPGPLGGRPSGLRWAISDRRSAILVLLPLLATVVVVAAPLAINPRLHLRADALSNTAIAHAVLRHGVPPRDPYLAGQPLHYHWAYNAAAAWLSRVLGVEPLGVMVWLGPIGLGVVAAAAAGMAWRASGGAPQSALLAMLLAVVGLNGWGAVILLGRLAVGGTTLADALGAGVHPYLRAVVYDYDERLGFFATKALVSTAFIWNLAFAMIAVAALARFLAAGRWWEGVVLALAAAAAAYANLLVGSAVMGLAAAALGGWAALGRRQAGGAVRRGLVGLCLVAGAAALVVPYVWNTLGGVGEGGPLVRLGCDARRLRGFVLGLAPLWACVALVGKVRRPGVEHLVSLFVAAGLGAAFLVFRVVDDVQGKFLFGAGLMLAVYVAGRLPELSRRRRVAVCVVAASCVPTTLLGLVAYGRAPDTLRLSEAEAATHGWIARHTPLDAVVVANERSTLVPVLARRDLYLPDRIGFHRGARYDPLVWARRSRQMRRLFADHEAEEVLGEIARELGRPVVLITRGWPRGKASPHLRRLHSVGDMDTWRFVGPGHRPPAQPSKGQRPSP